MDEQEQKIQEMEKELNELRPLKDSSVKLQEEFKQKEEVWLKEKIDLEQQLNPNWQKARQKMSALEAALKEKGVELNEDGSVKNNPQNVDIEKIRQEAITAANTAANTTLLEGRLAEILDEYDVDSARIVRSYYDRLTAGQGVTLKNVRSFVGEAEAAARVGSGSQINKIRTAANYSGGQGPRQSEENKLDDSTAKEVGSILGLKFVKGGDKK